MSEYREEDLFDMSDEELEAAFKEASAVEASTDVEEFEQDEVVDDVDVDEGDEDLSEFDTEEDVDTDEEEFDEDGSEQPQDEDSDHDASTEDDDEVSEEEDSEETDEDDPDGDSEEDEADTTDEDKDSEEDVQPVQKYKFKANGKEYEFSPEEIQAQFPRIFGQAMDYTKKMQTIKPWRKTIDALEQAEIKQDDVNLMIDVLKGDKEAIAEVLKRTGTDALDLDTENSKYEAKDYGRDDTTLALNDVLEDISKDVEYSTTHNILSKQWDDSSWNELASNPTTIKLLHEDVKNGMYAKVQPIAEKLKVYDGGTQSDLDYYKKAAQQYFSELRQQEATMTLREEAAAKKAEAEAQRQAEQDRLTEVKAKQKARQTTKKASAKRKAAAPSRSNAGDRGAGVVDYLDTSDEAFEDWYKNLEEPVT